MTGLKVALKHLFGGSKVASEICDRGFNLQWYFSPDSGLGDCAVQLLDFANSDYLLRTAPARGSCRSSRSIPTRSFNFWLATTHQLTTRMCTRSAQILRRRRHLAFVIFLYEYCAIGYGTGRIASGCIYTASSAAVSINHGRLPGSSRMTARKNCTRR